MRLLGLLGILIVAAGCSGGSDDGDVAGATTAENASPKSPQDLPADMDPKARAQATSAIGQRNAIDDHMNRQMEAMKRSQGVK